MQIERQMEDFSAFKETNKKKTAKHTSTHRVTWAIKMPDNKVKMHPICPPISPVRTFVVVVVVVCLFVCCLLLLFIPLPTNHVTNPCVALWYKKMDAPPPWSAPALWGPRRDKFLSFSKVEHCKNHLSRLSIPIGSQMVRDEYYR